MEDVGDPIPAYIQTWWEDHKKWDEWRDSDYRGPMPEFKSRRW
jgi:hypothetical protein